MTNMDASRLSSILEDVKRVVLKVGEIQRSYFGKKIDIHEKSDHSLVTNVDIESDNYLTSHLKSFLPQAAFFTEESGLSTEKESDFFWVIDPLDGTRNFTYGNPHFSISVALLFKSEPILGVIYDPILNELFYAQKGKGAFLNGKPLKIIDKGFGKKFILGLCGPSTLEEASILFSMIEKSKGRDFAYRKLGSAALNMAYVAASRFNASLCLGVKSWDVAAGVVIILEAGGLVSPIVFDTNGHEIEKFFTSDQNNFAHIEKLIS